jgi:hypothetical protein
MKKKWLISSIITLALIGSFFLGQQFSSEVAARSSTLWRSLLLKTGQTTSYVDYDDGYYEKGIAKSYTVLTAGQFSGTKNIDLTHLVSNSGAFVAATQTYTDAGKCGVFLAAGGDIIVITGSASNNGTFTTASATANTVVVTAGFVDEADAPETTFKKREAHSNACVLDNNTGLMWSQTVCGKMGSASDGLLPWTTHANGYGINTYVVAVNAGTGLATYTDWRIPNDLELASLRKMEAPLANPDGVAFPGWPSGCIVWSSTTLPAFTGSAMFVDYGEGNIYCTSKGNTNFVLLVRGG